MINIDKVIGKAVVYIGEVSPFFTNGEAYRIGRDKHGTIYTIDNEGDRHVMDGDWLSENFDVSEYIEKPSLAGKYVRYIYDGSDFMSEGDIGIVIEDNYEGQSMLVRWLNPKKTMSDGSTNWICSLSTVEVVA
jgi:hypothetical protein